MLPYLFAGGGFRTFAAEDSDVIVFPLPFFAGERRAALHAGVGFEVPVKKFLLNLEIADYYGEIMHFGKVHDLHMNMVVGYTGSAHCSGSSSRISPRSSCRRRRSGGSGRVFPRRARRGRRTA